MNRSTEIPQELAAERPRSSDAEFTRSMERRMLGAFASFHPEALSALGLEDVDEQIRNLPLDLDDRRASLFDEIRHDLRNRLKVPATQAQEDSSERRDLRILLRTAENEHRFFRLRARLVVPRLDLARDVHLGISGLLDPQVDARRRAAVVVRLRRYAGLVGDAGLVEQAMLFLRDRRAAGLTPPPRRAIEREIVDLLRCLDASQDLLERYDVAGWKRPWLALREQLLEYGSFLRAEAIPHGRDDFQLPDELYEAGIRRQGIDFGLDELLRRARAAAAELQFVEEALAVQLAHRRGWRETAPDAVWARLRENPLGGQELLRRAQRLQEDLRRILQREDLATLPRNFLPMRLATPPESLLTKSALLRIPRLIGNLGETSVLVLPDLLPGADDDLSTEYAHDAAVWSSVVREALPGLGLFFSAVLDAEHGLARGLIGLHEALLRGWALYAETMMRSRVPLAAQWISLRRRKLAALRAFLDPGLHRGLVSPEEAQSVLTESGLSPARARREIELYAFAEPGRAAAAFAGEARLLELRGEVKARLGPDFDERSFHDVLLSRGGVPFDLQRTEVLDTLVPDYSPR